MRRSAVVTSSYTACVRCSCFVWLGLREDERTETEGARAADRAGEVHCNQHAGEPREARRSLQKAGVGGEMASECGSSGRGFGAGSLTAALYGCVRGRGVFCV